MSFYSGKFGLPYLSDIESPGKKSGLFLYLSLIKKDEADLLFETDTC